MNKLTHKKCGKEISFEEITKGYYAQCPSCDEDLFTFEVEEGK